LYFPKEKKGEEEGQFLESVVFIFTVFFFFCFVVGEKEPILGKKGSDGEENENER